MSSEAAYWIFVVMLMFIAGLIVGGLSADCGEALAWHGVMAP